MSHTTSAIGLVALMLVCLVALVGPLFVRDTTPDINDQQPTIALKEPGFKTQMLLLKPYGKNIEKTGSAVKPKKIPILSAHRMEDEVQYTNQYAQTSFVPRDRLFYPTLAESVVADTYWLGTDTYGRSILSRLVNGIRLSLFVGLFAVVISLLIGITMGLIGGYYGGYVDKIVMYFVNVAWSVPTLLLVFAIVLAMGRGLSVIILAIGLTMWVDVARIVRGQTKQYKEELFVKAAQVLGVGDVRVLFRHILPNIVGPILVVAAANFASAILIEAGLSYLGFGIKPPAPSIGNMLNEHYGYAITGKPMLAFIPAITIMILVLAVNMLGSGMRDVFDVKRVDQ